MKPRSRTFFVRLALIAVPVWWLGSLGLLPYLRGQNQAPTKGGNTAKTDKPPAQGHAWTLDEAMAQVRLNPQDAYLQYVVLQLARREGRVEEFAGQIESLSGLFAGPAPNRAAQVDLFSIFTGALAVQESLQLDTMRGERARRGPPQLPVLDAPPGAPAPPAPPSAPKKKPDAKVAVASLKGPTIQSHPWEKLLGARKVDVSPLAHWVPEDFFFAEFRSYPKMLDALELSTLWGAHLFNQASRDARTQLVGQRLKKQLAVETSPWSRVVADQIIEETAVTGSDLFHGEGSDLTLLFRCKQPEVFKAAMEEMAKRARKARPDARQTTGTCLGVPFVHLATTDREICLYAAYPQPNLHVRSNSEAALRRVLEAGLGKPAEGKPARGLWDSAEFAYLRTLMPRGAPEEDGFIYLSDPFIRRLVGPQVKLTERRRMLCYNHLRMINHAALLYRTETGKTARSLEELNQAGCTPGLFGEGALACPDGGHYTLSADGSTGICSHHNHSRFMTPCCEIPVSQVSAEEANEYQAFLQEYNQYWRTYFDPIAIRVQITPQRYRLETIVLPLIDNTIYQTLAKSLGGKPEALDALPVPRRNIFSVALRFNKEELTKYAGGGGSTLPSTNNLKQIGLAMWNYHDANGRFPAAYSTDKQGKPLLSWRVHLLPYLEQQVLYHEFHLDEPWDSPHNKKLIGRMPAVYRFGAPSAVDKTDADGKTRYLVPRGEATMFPGDKGVKVAEITDGTSNTVLAVEADEAHAVVWTKPEDWSYDPKKPLDGVRNAHPDGFLVAMADGSVHFMSNTIDPTTWGALLTRSGGEPVGLQKGDEVRGRGVIDLTDIPGVPPDALSGLPYQEFLTRGIGSQVGLHVYDAVPLFDFDLPSFFGMSLGHFNSRTPMGEGGMFLPIGFLVSALNSPVYVSLPVQDAQVVDRFLDSLDKLLARLARESRNHGLGWFRIEHDFYRLKADPRMTVRCYNIGLWAFKWRVFWARIGNGLYVASKPFILEDLAALEAEKSAAPTAAQPTGHAMIRMRPQNWNQVLRDYRLGWEENNRDACLNNLGPLASVARAFRAGEDKGAQGAGPGSPIYQEAVKLYGVHFVCPDGGKYEVSPDGKTCTCSVHGSMLEPRQGAAPAEESATSKLVRSFGGLTATLTFLEDGLHAVVTIDRK